MRRLKTALAAVPVAVLAACGGTSSNAGAPHPDAASTTTPTRAPAPSPTGNASPSGSPSAGGSPLTAESAARPLAGKTVTVDPGHNGGNEKHPSIIDRLVSAGPFKKACNTTGTDTNAGYSEHAFTWDVANRLAAVLRKEGAKVVMTRSNDTGVGPCVNERASIGNKAHSNAVIAIHGDGANASGYGFHVIEPELIKGYTDSIVAPSRKLGTAVRDAFHSGTGEAYSTYLGHNGLDVRGDLGGLNLSKVPAVFIECGNMRNKGDAAKMTSAAWRQKAAEALAAGLVKYLKG
jgi:N-acetylmuramoyl-L-alanine amidase